VVQPIFEVTMREYGVPEAMRTDNGPPFASVGLGRVDAAVDLVVALGDSAGAQSAWMSAGQRAATKECIETLGGANGATARQRILEPNNEPSMSFGENTMRSGPTKGWGGRSPAEVYQLSPREFPERLAPSGI